MQRGWVQGHDKVAIVVKNNKPYQELATNTLFKCFILCHTALMFILLTLTKKNKRAWRLLHLPMRKLKHRKLSTLSKIKNQQADQEPEVVTGQVTGQGNARTIQRQSVRVCVHTCA